MNEFLARNLPPGYEFKNEVKAVSVSFAGGVIISLFGFFIEYSSARQFLYLQTGTVRILDENAVMPDFVYILGGKLNILLILAGLAFVISSAIHYAYFHSGSKSFYLMLRLPHRFELHKRSMLIPLIYALMFLLAAAILLLVYYAAYMTKTPEPCLRPDQWRKIWQ